MNVLEQVALAWQCLRYAFCQLLSPTLWAPWLVVGVAQSMVIVALWWFAHPWLSWVVAPLLVAAAGPEVLRYPNLFRLLPALFSRVDLVIGASLGALAAGASTALFAARAAGGEPGPSAAWRQAFGRAVPLILVNLPLTLIAVALSYGLEAWLVARGSSGEVRRTAHWMSLGAAFLCQAWFLYVNALVILGRRGWLAALAALPRTAARGWVAALFLTLATLLPLLPIQWLASTSNALVDRGVPELVGWLVVAQVGVALLGSFLLTGGATLFFQSALAEPRDGRQP
jgi:hypothetical protein